MMPRRNSAPHIGIARGFAVVAILAIIALSLAVTPISHVASGPFIAPKVDSRIKRIEAANDQSTCK